MSFLKWPRFSSLFVHESISVSARAFGPSGWRVAGSLASRAPGALGRGVLLFLETARGDLENPQI